MNNPFNRIWSGMKATNWRASGKAAVNMSPVAAAGVAGIGAGTGLVSSSRGHRTSGVLKGAAAGLAITAAGAAGMSVWAQRALRAAA